jgi:hypothetical protein
VLRWLLDSERSSSGPAGLGAVPSSAWCRGFVRSHLQSHSSSAVSPRAVGLLRSARPGCSFGEVGAGGSAAAASLELYSASNSADRCARRSRRRIVGVVALRRRHNNSQVRTLVSNAVSLCSGGGAAQLDR